MNVTMFNTASWTGSSIFAGNLPMMQRSGLKSTREKVERQQKAQSQIAFWESQKESLKNIECDTLEEIAKKLDKFRSYESEIDAVKMQYNQEQMWHAMDEAKEIGEKLEPKTAEERGEDMVEEALGADESKGELTESMEKMQEEMAELSEDMSQTIEEAAESVEEMHDNMAEESVEAVEDTASAEMSVSSAEFSANYTIKYKRIDVLI